MAELSDQLALTKAILSNPQMIRVNPRISWFLLQYMRKFNVTRAGRHLVLHSHLPPVNSEAYTRFIDEHLLGRTAGPSHAQVGVTNLCPQNCVYCYNKHRSGTAMDTPTIKKLVRDLKEMGVFWLGFTGGEPLLNKDLVDIAASAGEGVALKLFTTGTGLTRQLAADLASAGVFSISISLDHWQEERHDEARRCPGAYRTALRAIETLKNLGQVHVSVSTVLSGEMLREDQVEQLLEFLTGLGVQEAWLSESKPSVAALWREEAVITDAQRRDLIAIQDRHNKRGKLTVNYLGHFESGEHFGCNAGHKMVYVDAFGDVSPCVFTPMTMGNVRTRPVREIVAEMSRRFRPGRRCFINGNYQLLRKHYNGDGPLTQEGTLAMLEEVHFGPLPRFLQLHYNQG